MEHASPRPPPPRAEAAGVASWLWRARVADPVDRRNAPMLQVVLLLLGLAPPAAWAYRGLFSGIPWRAGETTSLIVSLAISAVALLGVALIRRGRFQWAIRQMLALVAVAMILDAALEGGHRDSYELPLAVVWMVLAGLMVGRRALWLMYGCVLASFVVGAFADLRSGRPGDTGSNLAVMIAINGLIFLLIAIVVDRSVRALRESLAEATRRGDELALANRRLEAEMAERESMRQQLVHAQKVEAVGRLAGGVAHDFNHLLGLILGYAAKGRVLDDPAELRKALAGVDAAGRRAAAVTNKLLTFARREVGRVERFDAAAALRELQPMLQQLFPPQVRAGCEAPSVPLPIVFDRACFDLMVLGVAANANDAMPDGGRFDVALRTLDGTRIELTLRDDGHGMEAAVRERAFEPFFTTKPPGLGTGLGLSVVHDLVVDAGGSVAIDSAPRRGTTVRIVLPLARAGAADG